MTDALKHANELVDDFRGNKTCSCEFCERASEILPELVAECELLQFAIKQDDDLANEQLAECERLQGELDHWQKIAAKAAATASKAIETTDVDWHKIVSEEDIQEAARELGIATGNHIREPTKMMLTAEQRAALEIAANICSENVVGDLVTVHDVHQAGITIKNLVDRSWTSIAQDSGPRYGGQIALSTERRAALAQIYSLLETMQTNASDIDSEYTFGSLMDVIRAMLSQSRPVWEITEERKAVMKSIVEQYSPQAVIIEYSIMPDEIEVIAKMLEEAK